MLLGEGYKIESKPIYLTNLFVYFSLTILCCESLSPLRASNISLKSNQWFVSNVWIFSGLNLTSDVGAGSSNSNENLNNEKQLVPQPNVREQEHFLPISSVVRIMQSILPSHAKISDEAKQTIQECASGFICFITGEANEKCHREQRRTVTADDVLWAMHKLGFRNYVELLSVFLTRYRKNEGVDHNVELAIGVKRNNAGYGVGVGMPQALPPPAALPPPRPTSDGSGFPEGPDPDQEMFDPVTRGLIGGFKQKFELGGGSGGSSSAQNASAYFGHGGDGGSSSSAQDAPASFDSYAQLKRQRF